MACQNSTIVQLPIDQAWEKLKNFHDMSWAPNVITSVEKVGDKSGLEIGAKRILNQAFHETLTVFDEESKQIKYTIDNGPEALSPDNVQGYVGEVTLTPLSENETKVQWDASWENEGDKDVHAFCDPVYKALLADMAENLK